MNNRPVYFLALALTAVGLLVFACKLAFTGLPITPGELASAWHVERQISFVADGGPVKLVINVPGETQDKAIVRERVVAHQFGFNRGRQGDNRQLTLSTRNAHGQQVIFYKTVVHRYKSLGASAPTPEPVFVNPPVDSAKMLAARELLTIAAQRSADDTTLVATLLGLLDVNALADNIATLSDGDSESANKADAAVSILALRGIAARRVNGINLGNDQNRVKIIHWLEVHIDGHWKSFSVKTAESRIPDTYLPWWRGSSPLITLQGGSNLKTAISLVRIEQRVLDQVLSGGDALREQFMKFSLYGLPLASQHVFRTLMVVPLGIFALVLIRNVIGARSLGTFMPVLIALALHAGTLIWGTVLFIGVIALGLLFRLYLEHLKLLLVPRLAAVLIFVVLLMATMTIITHMLGFDEGLSIALFPMVILTMTIERISVLWDERGAAEAIMQGLNSLAIALILCVVMALPIFVHLFFTFPELLLIIMAGTVLLGRYTGYRLLELPRFRALAAKAK